MECIMVATYLINYVEDCPPYGNQRHASTVIKLEKLIKTEKDIEYVGEKIQKEYEEFGVEYNPIITVLTFTRLS